MSQPDDPLAPIGADARDADACDDDRLPPRPERREEWHEARREARDAHQPRPPWRSSLDDDDPGPGDEHAPPSHRAPRSRRTRTGNALHVVDGDAASAPVLADLHRDERGRIVASPANAAILFAHHPAWCDVLEYEERTGRVVIAKPPPVPATLAIDGDTYPREVIDPDLVRAAAWTEAQLGVMFGSISLSAGIDAAARRRSRDPVREYLDGLAWDGTPRVDTWLHVYLGAPDDAYTRGVGAAWLVSGVARTYRPGCQADHLLVLEGPQGSGKSSALRILACKPAWFADGVPGLGSKDAADALRGPWIIELGELDALQRAELATIKAFVSRCSDRYRESYGRRTADHPRRVVFAGTTNEHAYLRDPTGARRFWPVRCGAIDRDALAADRDQLWAEALVRFRAGAPWHPDAALASLAASAQDARYQGDAWEGELAGYLDGRDETTVRELAVDALKIEIGKVDQRTQNRIVAALGRLGWTSTGNPVRRVIDGRVCRVRVYTAPRAAGASPPPTDEWGAP